MVTHHHELDAERWAAGAEEPEGQFIFQACDFSIDRNVLTADLMLTLSTGGSPVRITGSVNQSESKKKTC